MESSECAVRVEEAGTWAMLPTASKSHCKQVKHSETSVFRKGFNLGQGSCTCIGGIVAAFTLRVVELTAC